MAGTSGTPKGTLVAIGGNEDRKDDMAILRRIIEEVKGDARQVVVIAAASRDPVEASRPYLRAFEDLGIGRVRPLDLQSRREVEEDRTVDRLGQADIIYFTGGDQARLAEALEGSKALEVVRERYAQGAVVAGTSAGAAAMSETMIARGRADERFEKGRVEVARGMGLLPGAVIDTHFIQRGRFSRLLEVVTTRPDLLGIGVCENTAFVLREGRRMEVVGSDSVILVDGRQIGHTNSHDAAEGQSLAVEQAVVHALPEGYSFDIVDRRFHAPAAGLKVVA